MVQNRCKQEDGQWWCLVVGAKMNGADSGIWLFVYVANIQIGLQIYAVSSVKGLKGFLRHGLLQVPNLISINFSDQRVSFTGQGDTIHEAVIWRPKNCSS
ncbi:uncharacterized protein LOC122194516 isoform X2 [Lactuca sativa]|uniref:uncharacterized protein LOC122194516 isoform X2 n=1 Tax=Lactuca sativa TaxID=4236 RepID=UPI0022B01499|nr:uncharacterized protein LOC122194516 isoform X2 [Lactuca sativa]